jgi:hypothetical protein
MSDHVLALFVWQQVARATLLQRVTRDEAGEGVISAAIAVLIMAFLGAAMWVGFNTIWNDAEQDISEQVDRIGDDAPAPAPVDDGE